LEWPIGLGRQGDFDMETMDKTPAPQDNYGRNSVWPEAGMPARWVANWESQ